MRMSRGVIILLLALITSASLAAQAMPQMKTVEPDTAKVGDVLSIVGENLDKANVDKVYLTDGTNDFEVTVTDWDSKAMKVKVPEKVKPGRLALMVLTKGKKPTYIEQPVKVTIE